MQAEKLFPVFRQQRNMQTVVIRVRRRREEPTRRLRIVLSFRG